MMVLPVSGKSVSSDPGTKGGLAFPLGFHHVWRLVTEWAQHTHGNEAWLRVDLTGSTAKALFKLRLETLVDIDTIAMILNTAKMKNIYH